MLKFSLVFVFIFSLISCSSFEGSNNNQLYNEFEDDFFGGNTNQTTVDGRNNRMVDNQRNNQTNNNNAGQFGSGIEFDEYGEPINNYNNLPSGPTVNQGNGFGGSDNYIFSFSVSEGESLKDRMRDLLEPYGYKLIWKSEYEIYFENDVLYEDKLLVNVLKNISSDLLKMGIDIHINVYLKNKVVLVYSVRS